MILWISIHFKFGSRCRQKNDASKKYIINDGLNVNTISKPTIIFLQETCFITSDVRTKTHILHNVSQFDYLQYITTRPSPEGDVIEFDTKVQKCSSQKRVQFEALK